MKAWLRNEKVKGYIYFFLNNAVPNQSVHAPTIYHCKVTDYPPRRHYGCFKKRSSQKGMLEDIGSSMITYNVPFIPWDRGLGFLTSGCTVYAHLL